jgi:hypothetical protein
MRTKSLQGTLTDTKNDLREEARSMKGEIKINRKAMETKFETTRREFQTQLKEFVARDERERGTSAAKQPEFHGTT